MLSDPTFDKLWEQLLSERAGLDVVSGPTSLNQKLTGMEIGWEIDTTGRTTGKTIYGDSVPGLQTPALDDASYHFAGLRMTFRIMSGGDTLDLLCRGSYATYPGMDWGAFKGFAPYNSPGPKVLEKVRPKMARARARLRPNEYVCVNFGEVEPGRFATVFCKVDSIFGSGHAPKDFRPIPAEKIKISAWTVEGDTDALALCRKAAEVPFALTPSSKLEVDAIRRATKGEIVELPTLELQTGSPPRFWKQLPGIGFSANHLNHKSKAGLGLQIKLSEDKFYYGALEPGKTLAVEIPTTDGKGHRALFISTE